MNSNESSAEKSGERFTTADLARTPEQTRRHPEENIRSGHEAAVLDKKSASAAEGAAISTGTRAVLLESANTKDRPAQPHEQHETFAGLFEPGEAQRLRTRWTDIQAGFVDGPRDAVTQADGLVAEAMKKLAEVFANERSQLERQWDRGDNVTTEDLRLALRRYHAFFDRLLSV
ncbi:MAG TPA: hypothetical protein VNZ26_30395 [Vicinamibacterales bacterium]|nr:hypothetical protein [Vicinamibacterales bacterium]